MTHLRFRGRGELSMRLSLDRDWTDYVGTKPAREYRKIKVEIPDRLLSGLTVKTTNESIHVSPLSGVASVSLESNGGNVEFEKLFVSESLTVTAKNGNILGSVVGGWDDFSISCEIKKGESNFVPENKTGGDETTCGELQQWRHPNRFCGGMTGVAAGKRRMMLRRRMARKQKAPGKRTPAKGRKFV